MENCMDLPDKRSCNSSHLPDFNTDIKVSIMCSVLLENSTHFRFVTNSSNPIGHGTPSKLSVLTDDSDIARNQLIKTCV